MCPVYIVALNIMSYIYEYDTFDIIASQLLYELINWRVKIKKNTS